MYKIHQIFLVLFFLIFLLTSLIFSDVYAQPTVKLEIYPDIPEIPIGVISQICIIARSSEENIIFKWDKKGPGKFREEKTRFIRIYEAPENIDGESKRVTITVTMINDDLEEIADDVTFTLTSKTIIPTPVPISIRKVYLKERDDTIINPIYVVEPGESVTIAVEITSPSNRNIGVEYTAIFGKVEESSQQGEIIYTAPKNPGGKDIVTVRAVDKDTDEILVQEIVNITIRDKSQ